MKKPDSTIIPTSIYKLYVTVDEKTNKLVGSKDDVPFFSTVIASQVIAHRAKIQTKTGLIGVKNSYE